MRASPNVAVDDGGGVHVKKTIAGAAAALLLGGVSLAGDEGTGGSGPQTKNAQSAPMNQPVPAGQVLDVEELRDDLNRFTNQTVKVAAEIDTWIGPRAFIIESGGIINDHVLVVVPPAAKGIQAKDLKTDDDVLITGKVRALTVLELERELGWNLEPQLEAELSTTRILVADNIGYQQD
jgi:hypothetical protein